MIAEGHRIRLNGGGLFTRQVLSWSLPLLVGQYLFNESLSLSLCRRHSLFAACFGCFPSSGALVTHLKGTGCQAESLLLCHMRQVNPVLWCVSYWTVNL